MAAAERVTNDLFVTAHDGLELAVRDHGGEGPDVVFLHGVQRTLEDWTPVLERLSGVRPITMLAMGFAVGHLDCPGVMDIDGFDFRQRELLDELESSVVDAFLDDFRANASVVPADGGDDTWLAEQQASIGQLNEMWKVPDEVASATLDRVFVRTADGWEREGRHEREA